MERFPASVIIQARMSSSRLPGKVLLDLGGRPMIEHVLKRAKAIEGAGKVIIATGEGPENLPLRAIAETAGVEFFQGPEDNVLERYYLAWKKFPSEYVIRVTGDNPFTDPEYASMALEIALESGADLCSLANIPLGTAVEIISAQALEAAHKNSDKKYHTEHVTPYIKEHTELFRVERHSVNFDNPFEDLRLTVDTAEDYELAKAVYGGLYRGRIFPLSEVISFLKERPSLAEINRSVKQRPMNHFSGR